MPPKLGNGKICYLQIPALNIESSSSFYAAVFGWQLRRSPDRVAFDDGVGEVSGAWVTGRPPSATPGLLVYVMVDSVAKTIEAVTANGGGLVQGIGGDPGEVTARVRDPAGNVIGLYEHPR
jgi:predicted enzyme related to lactoylglutathione lyase